MQKPSFDAWVYECQVIVDRLSTIVHIYNKPPHPDVFMPLTTLQKKAAETADILRRIHGFSDPDELMSYPSAEKEETVIAEIAPLFQDVLRRLPAWSADMQALLKSPWFDDCAGRLATELFRGPAGREEEGIGSGMVENGRLPKVLAEMLEQEQLGEERPVREPHAERAGDRDQTAKRWTKHNTSFLRTAGRVD